MLPAFCFCIFYERTRARARERKRLSLNRNWQTLLTSTIYALVLCETPVLFND